MSLSTAYFDSLPYFDEDPTPQERAAAELLISAEVASTPASTSMSPAAPALPPSYTPTFTPAMSTLLLSLASTYPRQTRLSAIDTSRYQAPEQPVDTVPSPAELRRAGAAHAYLTGRRAHLALLDRRGPDAWRLGNYVVEAELGALERELAGVKRDIDVLAARRQRAQADVAGELGGLRDAWRSGVERMVDVQVAVELTGAEMRSRLRE